MPILISPITDIKQVHDGYLLSFEDERYYLLPIESIISRLMTIDFNTIGTSIQSMSLWKYRLNVELQVKLIKKKHLITLIKCLEYVELNYVESFTYLLKD